MSFLNDTEREKQKHVTLRDNKKNFGERKVKTDVGERMSRPQDRP